MNEQQEDNYYKQQYDQIRQRERLSAQQIEPVVSDSAGQFRADEGSADREMSRIGGPAQQLKEKTKGEVTKTVLKSSSKKIIWSVIGTSGFIISIIVGCIIIVTLILGLVLYTCNENSFAAKAVQWASTIAAKLKITEDFCSYFKISDKSGTVSSKEFIGSRNVSQIEAQLTPIQGVPVDTELSDWRAQVKSCLLRKLQQLYALSQQQNPRIDWVVTSGYRPESTGSYHQSGEAVDLALRNPTPVRNNGIRPPNYMLPGTNPPQDDVRITRLAQLARQVFLAPQADVIDEYNQPLERTEGGHIHVEYNLNRSSDPPVSYCDTVP